MILLQDHVIHFFVQTTLTSNVDKALNQSEVIQVHVVTLMYVKFEDIFI